MTLKTSTHHDALHLTANSFATSFFRPACPDATLRWLDLLFDTDVHVERDGDLMRLSADCDLPLFRYYAQDEPRKQGNRTDPQVYLNFDFLAEFSRLLASGTSADVWSVSPDGYPETHTATPPPMN